VATCARDGERGRFESDVVASKISGILLGRRAGG
jgi:hypothetical protein